MTYLIRETVRGAPEAPGLETALVLMLSVSLHLGKGSLKILVLEWFRTLARERQVEI